MQSKVCFVCKAAVADAWVGMECHIVIPIYVQLWSFQASYSALYMATKPLRDLCVYDD